MSPPYTWPFQFLNDDMKIMNKLPRSVYTFNWTYVVDHEEWGIEGNPWAAGHEGQNQRKHREDQSEQDPAVPGLQCHRGRSMKKCVHFRLSAKLFYCIEQFSIKSAIVVKLTFVMGVELIVRLWPYNSVWIITG